MEQSMMELVNPSTIMVANHRLNFGFAFNDSNFSDRFLRIEIVPDSPETMSDSPESMSDSPESNPDGEGYGTIADSASNRKRKSEEITSVDVQEAVAIIDSPLNLDLRVENINISSPILSAHSPFFYKLFSNGMKESEQRYATLQIRASEEDALMDVLNFMYSNTLKASTLKDLLDVLMAADKFEVASCMSYCIQLLQRFPMSVESALTYLDLPSSMLMAEAVRPLIDAAKNFLGLQFKNITKIDELMNLPLVGIEAVLSSNELQVNSENEVYDLALKWARTHYPNLEERREVLSNRLCPLIRSPHMTWAKLGEVMTCPDLEPKLASELVLHSIFAKFVPHSRQQALISLLNEANIFHRRCIKRAYEFQPVKVVEFEHPCKQCIVYLDLKKEECKGSVSEGSVDGQGFFLFVRRNMGRFFLCMRMQGKRSMDFGVAVEVAVRQMPGYDFVSKYAGNCRFTKEMAARDWVFVPWASFMVEDNQLFINDVLHLRFQLTITQ